MNIKIYVIGQDLRIKDSPTIQYASGTSNFIQFVFVSGTEWDGLSIYARFAQNGSNYDVYLDENHNAYMPSAIQPGKCTITLRGVRGSNLVATTNTIQLSVSDSGVINDAMSTDITPSLYEQLVALVTNVATPSETRRYMGIGQ